MIFDHLEAPMHYLEGIPAFKAGEWWGKKSCKFMPTRRIIHPKNHGIIFNDSNEKFIPRRRLLSQAPSAEYVFRPSIKIISKDYDINAKKKESIKIINPTYTQNKERPEKLHYFRYREEHIKELNEREKKFSEKKILDEEFKLLNNLGIKPKTDMSNYALLNNHGSSNSIDRINKTSINNYGKIGHNLDNYWLKKEKEKQFSMRMEKENSQKDVDYVKFLNTWEKNNLPKLITKQ